MTRGLAVVVSAGGMGMAAARRLAQHHRVLLVDRDGPRAREGAAILRVEGADACDLACDITDRAAVARLGERVDELGGFRALAHVAGLSPTMGDFRSIVRVDLGGAVAVARELLPRATAGSAAVFVASLAAHHPAPAPEIVALLEAVDAAGLEATLGAEATPNLAYRLAKWALVRYCRAQAPAWGERGARIASLSPGLIASPQGARESAANPVKQSMFGHTPLGREGTLLEIVDALEFLLSDRASFISGTDLLVDGGLAAALGRP
jgi:NAD(P)-dependent dehydrogenase (short-subunit alcohol dehydrogenase family)